MEHVAEAAFWVALAEIIWVNILLSGDNAVVIALAARGLPPAQRNKAIFGGSAAAIVLRVILTIFAVTLLEFPYLKIVGAVLLFYIGVQLLVPEEEHGGAPQAAGNLWAAVRTILLADLVMSVDNVIAVAAAADTGPPQSRILLLVVGLGLSIPLIIFGSQILLKVMERYPLIITLGAALLGFVAGEMLVTDHAVEAYFHGGGRASTTLIELACAVGVVLVGRWLAARKSVAPVEALPGAALPAAAATAVQAPLRRVLLAVDGSEASARGVQLALAMRAQWREPAATEWHLVNVQRPVAGEVSSVLSTASLEDYHRERAEVAFAPARAALAAAGIAFQEHLRLGLPGPAIAEVAKANACDLIVMGTHGLDSPTGAILGSVAQSTIEHSTVPVLLAK
jgi:YjbE family integral membrane protein